MRRLFLGFQVNPKQLPTLLELQQQLSHQSMQPVPAANLHLTLAFLGQTSDEQLTALLNHIPHWHKPSFTLELAEVVHWPKPKILALATEQVPTPLQALYQQGQTLAQQLGLHQNEHQFRPHITLFRKAKSLTSDDTFTLSLAPKQLHLFESLSTDNGVQYPILQSWDLL
ncbi:RNA 2',3'-cyclic phosphodiesterase [Shewanella marina]|uniref:RNA 2',3'-cyclic phosphodiesterase n=1 Tax=Shewanella marina TaxID=487319 RepID=UPI00046FA9CF|nr:RNA 2',3'-cyclic phosphodiesterase [Shewanella marina]